MHDLFLKLFNEINARTLMKHTEDMHNAEIGQTFKNYHKSAQHAKELMQEAGLHAVEIIEFPADGKTVYQDKRMPIGWDATIGKLTIKKSAVPFADHVIADFQCHPFHLIKGSVGMLKGGVDARIITEAQLFSGEDPKGGLVMTEPLTPPRQAILNAALDLGAIGIISDFLEGRYETPDAIQWVNACTEGCHWHVQSEDKAFIGFSVSPRTGDLIRHAATNGELIAHIECDGKRYIDQLPMVTGILPGKNKRELWVLSHLFEPLADDNASGVAASIEIARAIKTLSEKGAIPPLHFTLRLVFAMEFYGFAAYAEHLGGYLGDKTIGAINTDGMAVREHAPLDVYLAPPGAPFFGDYLMEIILNGCGSGNKALPQGPGMPNSSVQAVSIHEEGMYADDTLMNDPTIGVPTSWMLAGRTLWHNSAQTMNIISPACFKQSAAVTATWLAAILTMDDNNISKLIQSSAVFARKHLLEEYEMIMAELHASTTSKSAFDLKIIEERMLWRLAREKARLDNFGKTSSSPNLAAHEIECLRRETGNLITELKSKAAKIGMSGKPVSGEKNKWLNYAASMIPARKTRGFPHDQANVPKDQQINLPGYVIYGPLARLLANMDGKKDLKQLLIETEWESRAQFDHSSIKKYIDAVCFLADYGYLNVSYGRQLLKEDIIEALRKADVNNGDLLFIHSSLSSFGNIAGGADTVIDAFIEAVGPTGTLLFPTFTEPYIYFEGNCIKSKSYRPNDGMDPNLICTGRISKAFLKRSGIVNSAHATHSVAGLGPLARNCLAEHRQGDPPTCSRSPFGKLAENKGKIIYFGVSLANSTFLHFLEDKMNLPYLQNAVCRVKLADGSVKTILIPNHLPGHRDFYNPKWQETKIFKKLAEYGLPIKEVPLGLDFVRIINADAFNEYGGRALKENPHILLCDASDCFFCRHWTRRTEKMKED